VVGVVERLLNPRWNVLAALEGKPLADKHLVEISRQLKEGRLVPPLTTRELLSWQALAMGRETPEVTGTYTLMS
jgi:hypothetical protein